MSATTYTASIKLANGATQKVSVEAYADESIQSVQASSFCGSPKQSIGTFLPSDQSFL